MKSALVPAIIIALALTSCQKSISLDFDKTPAMELNGDVLYVEDIEEAMPANLSGSDSINFIESYKKKWAVDRLLFDKAMSNVGNTDEINSLVESYRRELIISEYLKKMTSQNVEPVSDDSIYNFYNSQKDKFLLSEPVAKGIFIKLSSTEPNQANLSKLLKEINDENLDKIMLYCTQHAVSYQFFLDAWVPYNKMSDLLEKPIDSTDPILSRGTVVQQTTDFTYYLKITGLCLAGTPQPLELVESDIMNIITNRQKFDYINQFHDELYKSAVKNGKLKLYNE